jgi:uncharacterized protein (DUF305 family)
MRYSDSSNTLYIGILLVSLVMFILCYTAISAARPARHLEDAMKIPQLRKNPNQFGTISQSDDSKATYTTAAQQDSVANHYGMSEPVAYRAHGMMHGQQFYSDRVYLSGMIAHHEAALEMAREELKKGRDPQVKRWAENILHTQKDEITQMRAWLKAMGGENPQAAEAMSRAMHTMMAAPESGNPDRNFVSTMIEHHAGAVEMASQAAVYSSNPKVVRLSKDIIDAQTREIDTYKRWLREKSPHTYAPGRR